jgi:probable phosphoglycerate mutase
MSATIVDLIRHGEPVGGRAIRGNSVDDPLSELGWQQMRLATKDYTKWNLIVSSPLVRCCDFSQEISEKLKIPLIIDDNLKEVGFGSWEGRTQEEIKKNNLNEYREFYLDPVNNRPKEAESLSGFYNRVVKSYNKIIEQYCGQQILIVTHAGVIRALITYILIAKLSSMYRIKVHNAGISRIVHNDGSSVLERHGFNLKDIE